MLGFVCTAFRSPRAVADELEALEELESLEGLALRRIEPRLSWRA